MRQARTESRPTRKPVASRQCVLGVRELPQGGVCAEQILGLVLQLFKIGADGEMTVGHDDLLEGCPGSAGRQGERRFSDEP